MDDMSLSVDMSALDTCPRARARFVSKSKAKSFTKLQSKYKRPDFARMILDLRNLGWSHSAIARVLSGISCPSVVSAWALGSCPNYDNGDEFIMLWKSQTGLDRYPRIGEWQDYQYVIGQLELSESHE